LVGTDSFTGLLSRTIGENIGSYAINQNTLALNSNYALSYNSANLTIGTKAIAVTATAKTKTYGDADPALTYTFSPVLVSGDSFTGSLSRTVGENTGNYTINQNTLALSSNYALTYTTANLAIGTRTVTVMADAKTKTYGDTDPALTYTFSPALVTGDSFTGVLSRTTGENVGSYVINQNTLALSSNYTMTYGGANLLIMQATALISLNNLAQTYDGAAKSVTATTTPVGLSGVAITYNGSLAAPTAPGSYRVIASLTNVNYTAPNANGTLTITDATSTTATLTGASFVYDGTSKSLAVANLPTGATVIYTGNGQTNVGTYTVTATVSQPNYNDQILTATLTVTDATSTTATLTGASFVYDGTSKSLAVANLPTGATVIYAGNGQINVGTYTVTATVSQPNYNDQTLTATLTVTNATSIAVTLTGASFTYDGTAKSLTVANLPAGATVSYTGNSQTNVGTYQVTAIVSQPNYNDQNLSATLMIIPATGTAILANGTFTYDGTVKTLAVGNLLPGATVSYSGNGQVNAGTYIITAVIKQPGFADQTLTATLLINQTPLTITPVNQSRIYGIANPALTVTYSGFVNGDTPNSLTTQPAISTTASINSAPGLYPITASGAVANNYLISYVPGALQVMPLSNANLGNLTISTGSLSPLFNTATTNYTISVPVIVSQVTITASYDPTASATINATAIPNGSPSYNIPITTGTTLIPVIVTAQDGVTKQTYTIVVTQAPASAPVAATNILSPNGDGKNDGWVVQDINLYPNNVVTIYDRGGRVVYTKKGYGNDWKGTVNNATLAQGTYFYTIQLDPLLPVIRGYITILKSR
jgi:gliding motility-associated-like protein